MEDEGGDGEAELAKLRLEEVGRESDFLVQDPVWIMLHALALIAFRDKKRIADGSWYGHVLYFGNNEQKDWDELTLRESASPSPVVIEPRKVLLQWLLDGKIKASLDGEEKLPSFWDNVQFYDLLKKYRHACFRRDDLVKLVFEGLQERAEAGPSVNAATAKTSFGKKGRKPKIDWKMVEAEMTHLMELHSDFSLDDPDWNCQACLERAVSKYIEKTFGEDAIKAESTIRQHVTKFLDERKAGN